MENSLREDWHKPQTNHSFKYTWANSDPDLENCFLIFPQGPVTLDVSQPRPPPTQDKEALSTWSLCYKPQSRNWEKNCTRHSKFFRNTCYSYINHLFHLQAQSIRNPPEDRKTACTQWSLKSVLGSSSSFANWCNTKKKIVIRIELWFEIYKMIYKSNNCPWVQGLINLLYNLKSY